MIQRDDKLYKIIRDFGKNNELYKIIRQFGRNNEEMIGPYYQYLTGTEFINELEISINEHNCDNDEIKELTEIFGIKYPNKFQLDELDQWMKFFDVEAYEAEQGINPFNVEFYEVRNFIQSIDEFKYEIEDLERSDKVNYTIENNKIHLLPANESKVSDDFKLEIEVLYNTDKRDNNLYFYIRPLSLLFSANRYIDKVLTTIILNLHGMVNDITSSNTSIENLRIIKLNITDINGNNLSDKEGSFGILSQIITINPTSISNGRLN